MKPIPAFEDFIELEEYERRVHAASAYLRRVKTATRKAERIWLLAHIEVINIEGLRPGGGFNHSRYAPLNRVARLFEKKRTK